MAHAREIPGGRLGCFVASGQERELCGGEAHTTNNRMELMGGDQGAGGLGAPARRGCIPTPSMCRRASANGYTAGSGAVGVLRTTSRSRMMDLWQELEQLAGDTSWSGYGLKVMPVMKGMNVPINWLIAASRDGRLTRINNMRQIILDTETTGLERSLGHRIIEIAAVEMVNRRLTNNHFHQYLNPRSRNRSGCAAGAWHQPRVSAGQAPVPRHCRGFSELCGGGRTGHSQCAV